ncbi:MAG: hypothetical protein P9L97_07430 [Candidatus Tenebribacter davisii]|nr:hypothetical protein [Candidatus Tenebribacter davisii]
MMNLFSDIVEYNMNNLRTWRQRYSPNEYPYKVAKNMFYDLIPLKMIWPDILACFNQGERANSIDEGRQYISQKFRRAQLTISNSMDKYMEEGIKIGDSNSARLKPIIEKAKLGENKCVEEIEYSYIARTSLKVFFLVWASLGLNGYSMEEAYEKLSHLTFQTVDFEDFTLVFKAFSSNVNIMIGGMSMGDENQIIKPLYIPLPDLWNSES